MLIPRCILSQGNLKEIGGRFSIQAVGVGELNGTFGKIFIKKVRRCESQDK